MDRSVLSPVLISVGLGVAVLTRLAVRFLDFPSEIARPVAIAALAVLAAGVVLYAWNAWQGRDGRPA